MPRRFVVQTDYKADGTQVMKTQDRMRRGFGKLATGLADSNSMIGRSFGKVNTAINRGVQIGMIALAGAAGLAAREYVNLDNAITNAGAKFTDISTTAADFGRRLDELSSAARAVGADTEYSATDAAGALDKFAMAGMNSQQSMALLRGTTDLATAAGTDLTTAVDIATDSLGAFNLEVDTAEQAQKSLARVSDVMAATTTSANTSLEEMFESIKAGAPAFTAAGQSVESFAAFTGILANAGVKGSTAGTNLRNVMLRLADPTAEAASVLKQLGVTTQDQNGNFRDIVDILGDFEKGLGGMGDAQRTAALSTIFGARAVTGVNILLAEGSDNLREYRNEIIAADGAASDMAAAIRTSLGNQIAVLKSGLIELGLQFVESFEQEGRGALQGLIDLVQTIDIKPIVNFAHTLVNIMKFIGKNWKLLLSLAVGIKAVAVAMGILNIVTQVFNVTLSASPVGKIITLVFLLATAITFLIMHWDEVLAFMKKVWRWIVDFFIGAWEWLKQALINAAEWIANVGQKFTFILGPLSLVTSALIEVIKQWDKIKTAFQEKGFFGGIWALGKAIISGVLAPLQGILELASRIPGVGNLAAGLNERIQQLRENLGTENIDIGTPETPKGGGPDFAPEAAYNRVDINIRDETGRAEANERGTMPQGIRLGFTPTLSE